jgi:hypothetical protein
MSSHRPWFVLGLVVAICRFSSPVLAQEPAATPRPVSLALKPVSAHLSLLLRGEGDSARTYTCEGPCVLDVTPGHYQLGVVDGQGKADWHAVDLSESETIEVHRPHRGLVITGVSLVATGAALAVAGTSAFIYGAVSNLETMECDSACGGVSTHFLKVSLAGAGIGLALAAVGGVLAYAASGPAVVEKPAEPAAIADRPRALSFVVMPDLHAPRTPIAAMSLTF